MREDYKPIDRLRIIESITITAVLLLPWILIHGITVVPIAVQLSNM